MKMLKEYGKTFSEIEMGGPIRIIDDIGSLNEAIEKGILGRLLLRDSSLKT